MLSRDLDIIYTNNVSVHGHVRSIPINNNADTFIIVLPPSCFVYEHDSLYML